MADLVTHDYTGSPAAGRGLVVFCGRLMEDRGAMASLPPVEHHRDQHLQREKGRIVAELQIN